jgi:hypothetical protein
MQEKYAETRMAVVKLLETQNAENYQYILKKLNHSERKIRTWSRSKKQAKKELFEVIGIIKIINDASLRQAISGLNHKGLIHFIIIWRYENKAQDAKTMAGLFGIAIQSCTACFFKAERNEDEAFKMVLACIGYNTYQAMNDDKNKIKSSAIK